MQTVLTYLGIAHNLDADLASPHPAAAVAALQAHIVATLYAARQCSAAATACPQQDAHLHSATDLQHAAKGTAHPGAHATACVQQETLQTWQHATATCQEQNASVCDDAAQQRGVTVCAIEHASLHAVPNSSLPAACAATPTKAQPLSDTQQTLLATPPSQRPKDAGMADGWMQPCTLEHLASAAQHPCKRAQHPPVQQYAGTKGGHRQTDGDSQQAATEAQCYHGDDKVTSDGSGALAPQDNVALVPRMAGCKPVQQGCTEHSGTVVPQWHEPAAEVTEVPVPGAIPFAAHHEHTPNAPALPAAMHVQLHTAGAVMQAPDADAGPTAMQQAENACLRDDQAAFAPLATALPPASSQPEQPDNTNLAAASPAVNAAKQDQRNCNASSKPAPGQARALHVASTSTGAGRSGRVYSEDTEGSSRRGKRSTRNGPWQKRKAAKAFTVRYCWTFAGCPPITQEPESSEP